jgi:uncharacterized spore protein YtfJ
VSAVDDLFSRVREGVSVREVFADAYERDGVTLLPAAVITSIGGGGSGTDHEDSEGGGGGFLQHARPIGAYVMSSGTVHWRPAVDLNRLVVTGAVVTLLVVMARGRRRSRSRREHAQAWPLEESGRT